MKQNNITLIAGMMVLCFSLGAQTKLDSIGTFKDIAAIPSLWYNKQFVYNDLLYIFGPHGLATTDGTFKNTKIISNINTSNSNFIVERDSVFYFTYSSQLWKTNQTKEGGAIIKDFKTGSIRHPAIVFKNKLWFVLQTSKNGKLVKQLYNYNLENETISNFSTQDSVEYFSDVVILGSTDSMLYLTCNIIKEGKGIELVKTDGTINGTTIVKDLNPIGNSFFSDFYIGNESIYFYADTISSTKNRSYLYKSDGTSNGTLKIPDTTAIRIAPKSDYSLYSSNGKVFFSRSEQLQFTGTYFTTWVSDGTQIGTKQLTTDFGTFSLGYTTYNDEVYFMNGSDHHTIYKYDGNNLKPIYKTGSFDETSTLVKSFILNDKLFYFYNDYNNTYYFPTNGILKNNFSDLIIIDNDTAYSLVNDLTNFFNVNEVMVLGNNLIVSTYEKSGESALYKLSFTNNSKEILIEPLYSYPNPVHNGMLTIDAPETGSISLTDMAGKTILKQAITQTGKQQIQLGTIQDGMYLVQLQCGEKVYTSKIVINK